MNLKKYTKNHNANIYLSAAEALGYQIEVISDISAFAKITSPLKTKYLYQNFLQANNRVASAFAKDKYLSSTYLGKKHPGSFPQLLVITVDDQKKQYRKALEFAHQQNFQVVVKANSLSLGQAVKVKPSNDEEIIKHLDSIFDNELDDLALIEEYIDAGKEYRIVVHNGDVLDVLERVPAFVIGDGHNSINSLIEEKNKLRQELEAKPIIINNNLVATLGKKQLTLNSVPKKDDRVVLQDVCNFAVGGEIKRIAIESIPEENLNLFQSIANQSMLSFIGLDLIANDVTQPLSKQTYGFNEINSSPMPDIHFFADQLENKGLDYAKKVIKRVYG